MDDIKERKSSRTGGVVGGRFVGPIISLVHTDETSEERRGALPLMGFVLF